VALTYFQPKTPTAIRLVPSQGDERLAIAPVKGAPDDVANIAPKGAIASKVYADAQAVVIKGFGADVVFGVAVALPAQTHFRQVPKGDAAADPVIVVKEPSPKGFAPPPINRKVRLPISVAIPRAEGAVGEKGKALEIRSGGVAEEGTEVGAEGSPT